MNTYCDVYVVGVVASSGCKLSSSMFILCSTLSKKSAASDAISAPSSFFTGDSISD